MKKKEFRYTAGVRNYSRFIDWIFEFLSRNHNEVAQRLATSLWRKIPSKYKKGRRPPALASKIPVTRNKFRGANGALSLGLYDQLQSAINSPDLSDSFSSELIRYKIPLTKEVDRALLKLNPRADSIFVERELALTGTTMWVTFCTWSRNTKTACSLFADVILDCNIDSKHGLPYTEIRPVLAQSNNPYMVYTDLKPTSDRWWTLWEWRIPMRPGQVLRLKMYDGGKCSERVHCYFSGGRLFRLPVEYEDRKDGLRQFELHPRG